MEDCFLANYLNILELIQRPRQKFTLAEGVFD